MRNQILILAASLTWLATNDSGAQPLTAPITNPANGHSYYLLGPNNWWNAESQAVALGGHLVTINNAAENTWVFDTFANLGGIPRGLLIGFTDAGHEGVWTWTSGEAVTYQNWASGEPNNGAGIYPYEDVAQMWSQVDPWPAGTWNDMLGTFPDQVNLFGVVEIVPEPAAAMLLMLAVSLGVFRRRLAK